MKALILAAGYGTTLQETLEKAGEFQELIGIPKPLIPLGDRLLIDYLVEQIKNTGKVDDIYVVTNDLYFNKFKDWAHQSGFELNNIINDGTRSNETRKGAVKDISIVVEEKKIEDNLLIMAGDTIFNCDLSEIIDYFHQKGNTVTHYLVSDDEVSKRGIIEINDEWRLTSFLEKPYLSETESRLVCPPLYIYNKQTLNLLPEFLEQNKEIKQRDGPGYFVKWLVEKNISIYSELKIKRLDVGDYEGLQKAKELMEVRK